MTQVKLKEVQDRTSFVSISKKGFLVILCGQEVIQYDGTTTRSVALHASFGQPFRFFESPDDRQYLFTDNGFILEIELDGIRKIGAIDREIVQQARQPIYPYVGEDGHIWITGLHPILEITSDGVRNANEIYSLPFAEPVSITRTADHATYAFGPDSVWQRSGKQWTPIPIPRTGQLSGIRDLAKDGNGNLWISCEGGVFVHKGNNWERMNLPSLSAQFNVWRLYPLDGSNAMIAVSTFKHLMLYRNGNWTDLSSLVPAECSRILRTVTDHEGNIWLSGWPSGLFRVTPSVVSTLEFPPELSASFMNFSYADDTGLLMVSTRQGLREISPDGVVHEVQHLPGYPLTIALSILKSSRGTYWIATSRGLFQFEHGLGSTILPRQVSQPESLMGLIEDREQHIWAMTRESRVFVQTDEGRTDLSLPLRNTGSYAISCVLGPNGYPLFGCGDGSLIQVLNNPLRAEAIASPVPADTAIHGLHIDADGDLWIATRGAGIFRRSGKNWVIYATTNGLPTNVYSFITSFGKHIVAGCDKGILLLNRETLAYRLLTKSDGLPSTNLYMVKAFHKPADNELLVATTRGIVKITNETLKYESPAPPKPNLLHVSVNEKGKPQLQIPSLSERMEMNPDTLAVTFTFTAVSFCCPDLVQLQYRLTDVTDWTSTGERSVTFWNLPPGEHTFQLRASNLRGGGWSEPVSTSFTILPHFWQTNWFRFLALLSILLFGVLMARLIDGLRRYYRDYRKRNFVGDYRLLSTIGKSGPATIYHAFHNRFESDVALKVIDIHDIDADAVDRFLREGELAEKSAHPNVVPIYEQGQVNDKLYIAMERITGYTLRHWIEKGPFPLPAVVETGLTLLNTITHLHSLDIAHRDLKPDNIMIRSPRDNQAGANQLPEKLADSIVLLDFGISKLLDQPAITQLDVTAGTPLYLPPEAFLGKPDTEGTADLYAIGIISYEIATGRHPYNFREESPYHVISKLLYSRPTPMREHLAHIPSQLDELIMKIIEPDYETRLKDARAIRQQLESILDLM